MIIDLRNLAFSFRDRNTAIFNAIISMYARMQPKSVVRSLALCRFPPNAMLCMDYVNPSELICLCPSRRSEAPHLSRVYLVLPVSSGNVFRLTYMVAIIKLMVPLFSSLVMQSADIEARLSIIEPRL